MQFDVEVCTSCKVRQHSRKLVSESNPTNCEIYIDKSKQLRYNKIEFGQEIVMSLPNCKSRHF
jgi:C4-type Zn-finger protein